MEERLCGGTSGVAGCVVFSMRRLHILRRLGRHDEVDELFKKLAESAKSSGPKMVNHFVVKHARFLASKQGDTAGALELLREAMKREPVCNHANDMCSFTMAVKTLHIYDYASALRLWLGENYWIVIIR